MDDASERWRRRDREGFHARGARNVFQRSLQKKQTSALMDTLLIEDGNQRTEEWKRKLEEGALHLVSTTDGLCLIVRYFQKRFVPT